MTALVQTTSGALAPRASIMGEQTQPRPQVIGRIRGGAKVLTPAAKAIPAAVETYEEFVANAAKDGIPDWDDVERAIKTRCPDLEKSPLTPINTPRFFLRRADFTNPEHYDQILDAYGEDMGGKRVLRRFPVILWHNDPASIMPHGFESWTRSELVRWSQPSENGMRCMQREQLDATPKDRRPRRTWGGRRTIDLGPCDPNNCNLYATSACGLVTRLFFYLPVLETSNCVMLTTKSIYSTKQWWETLHVAQRVRYSLDGVQNGEPFIWLNKVQRERPQIDHKLGKSVRRNLFLIEMESRLDMKQAYAELEQRRRIQLAQQQQIALAAPPPATHDEPLDIDLEGELVDVAESDVPY